MKELELNLCIVLPMISISAFYPRTIEPLIAILSLPSKAALHARPECDRRYPIGTGRSGGDGELKWQTTRRLPQFNLRYNGWMIYGASFWRKVGLRRQPVF